MSVSPVNALPPSYKFGFVAGRAIRAVADTLLDVDRYPEAESAEGTVTFTPEEKSRRDTGPHPAFVSHEPLTFPLHPKSGQIVDVTTAQEEAVLVDLGGGYNAWIVPGAAVSLWVGNWVATFKLNRGKIDPIPFTLTEMHTLGSPLELVDNAPYTPTPQTTVITTLVPSGGVDGQYLGRSGGQLTWLPGTGGGGGSAVWGAITGQPAVVAGGTDVPSARASISAAAVSHLHAAGDVTSGTFGVARLGTGTADSAKVLYGDGTWKTAPAPGGVTPDATTTAKGIVQLAGDLGGSSAAPTVPGLSGKANTTHNHNASDVNSGTLGTARLGSGTANSGKVLFGDSTWKDAPTGGSGPADWNTLLNMPTNVGAGPSPSIARAAIGALGIADLPNPVTWATIDKPSTFAPSAHNGSHAAGGTDEITPAAIGAALMEVRWTGSSWPTRTAGAPFGVVFLSTNDKDATAPPSGSLLVGDRWIRHPDAI